jgi:tripartite-type tricarboxylate transporter receptor subunit TctC
MNRPHLARRRMAAASLGGLALLALPALAQVYPARPIRIVVPWPAGGLVDVAARQLGTRLQAALGQPVVVDNRVGAGGNIGADLVARSAPDGYTLVFTTSALTINSVLQPRLPFSLTRDFEPLALVAHAPSVLVVGPAIAPQSVKDLVALAKARPGALSYASAGVGSPAHLTGEMFKVMQKVFVVHVPYTGAPAAIADQIAGRVDYQFANAAVALPQIRAGRLKALAVTSATRFAALPEVPTLAEAGVPGFEADQWLGLLAPRGLPPPVARRLLEEVNKALVGDDLRSSLAQSGMSTAGAGTPAAFEAFLRQDLAKWAAVVEAQQIKPE